MADLRVGGLGPMGWHLGLGAALIAASLGLPWWSAERTARAEARAGQIVEVLLAAGVAAGRDEAPDPEHVFARAVLLAGARGAWHADLERAPAQDGDLLAATTKHYAFRLAAMPLDADARAVAGSLPPLAALAWPLAASGPAHGMFFAPEDEPRAYTRNLTNNAYGFAERRPQARAGRRKTANSFDTRTAYRGVDEERWILH